MVFSRIAEVVSAAASRLSAPKSSTLPYVSSGLLPPSNSVYGYGFANSGQKNNLRLSSSLQDFSTYRRLDPESDLNLGIDESLIHAKQPNLLQRGNAGSSFSKEKASPGSPLARKKWARVVMVLLCLLLFAVLIYTLLFFYSNWSQGTSKFYVVLDCGSTGTRVYVYQASVNYKKDGSLPILLRSLPEEGLQRKPSLRSGRAYNRMETEPGFDKLVHNISGLRKAIKPLIQWAKKQIPEHAHKTTSLFLYATAGVRRLPSSDSQWLLNNAWSILKSSPFWCERGWVKIISGMEEAYYGWIALNYHTEVLGAIPKKATYGALDLGGSSLQVTFESKEHVRDETSLQLSIGPVKHHLSAYSLSGYGLNDAFDKSVVHLVKKLPEITNADLAGGHIEIKHPCLQTGYKEQYFCSQCASIFDSSGRGRRKMDREDEKPSLATPLIDILHEDDGKGLDFDREERNKNSDEKGINKRNKEIVEEVKKQLWLAGPLICVSLLQFCLQLISVMFVGHLGELVLSGASMASSFASVTGFSMLLGMASALDTLCGQSYGAKQYHMLGIQMQKAMLVLSLVSIPLAVIWANTGPILVFLGQDPDISEQAQLYACYMIPSIFAYGLLQCLVKFLQTQNIVFPMMISSGITTLIHLLVCWLLVFKSGLGIRGAALANSISYWTNVALLVLYVKFSPSCAKSWTGFSKEALHNIPTFIKLAIPSAVMVCLEMWSFEMMVLLSGLLPNPQLETSVLSICLNTASTVWMIPYGLSNAVSTRVSNELGAGHPQTARLAVCVVIVMAITESVLVGAILILIRNIWGYAYSNEIQVVRYVATMMPILAISNFLDGLQCVLSGAVRGCGWQKVGAFVNLGSYYLVGIPSALLLAFVIHVGGRGLWLGIICGLIVQVLSLLIITLRTNWEQEAKKATERVYDSIIPVDIVS